MKELSNDTFDGFLKKNEKVAVDFWAPWCMPCLAMAPVFEEMEKEMNGISFGKVNVDENGELAQRFGIMSIPTLIFFSKGAEVDRIVGAFSKRELKEWLTRASQR
ncbi:MAG: thioredoxin [Thermoplasmata archaeon]|nr:MAG: thioredoxin [Thermoplasmata archaeon]